MTKYNVSEIRPRTPEHVRRTGTTRDKRPMHSTRDKERVQSGRFRPSSSLGATRSSHEPQQPLSRSRRSRARAHSTEHAGPTAVAQPACGRRSTPHRSPRASLLEARLRPATPASSRASPRVVGGRSSACWQHLQRGRQRTAHAALRAGSREHSEHSTLVTPRVIADSLVRPFC